MRDWTIKFESWLKAHIPLGISVERERVNLMLGLFLSALWAVVAYMGAYAMALSDLYTTKNGKRILLLDSRMADFGQVFRFVPAGFLILIGLLVAKGFWFQAYHRQGSMSIYLMRRLPGPQRICPSVLDAAADRCGDMPGTDGSDHSGMLPDLYEVYAGILSGAGTVDALLERADREMSAMLELKQVIKQYGSKTALDGVDLKIPQGEIVGLFGENGAGKTTLMKCVFGFIPYKGTITLDGEPITPKNITRLSFATCEHSFFPNLSPESHRQFYQEHFPNFRDKRFRALLDFFELPAHKPARSFSTGQKNQLEVILALSQGADYILMDEPFAGNDVFNREDFYKVLLGILEPNETVLLSTHLLEEVEHFIGRALLLQKGKLVGDVTTLELEEQGKTLMDFVKETYRYKADRVVQALKDLTGEEEP